ncbi:iron ABC transporter permease [Carboxydothermus islandicus]|uniref:Iron ABC transporter permease n=1 Tax=Carboxydothermus islandicus TaxID=661089 RepID=A0A1L8D2P3_9THEO|nr:iron ABC transporter permease [Carboxydothermus islandicus]GAV25455.1 iron ABC transporter permease [Carboxydothermus islandicus]
MKSWWVKLIFGGVVLLLLLIFAIFLAANLGAVKIPLTQILTEPYKTIFFKIRLPRIALGIVVGAALGLAGTVYQGVLKTPLADPYILGVSSGAAAAVALLTLLKSFPYYALPLGAFLGSIVALLLVFLISRKPEPNRLILAGIIVNSFLGAIVTFVLAVSRENMHQIIYWLMGGLNNKGFKEAGVIALYLLLGLVLLFVFARDLNAMSFGDDTAVQLGVEVNKKRVLFLMLASFLTAGAVSFAGTIGFVGLVVPQVVELIFGKDYRVLIPLSSLAGAILLVFADALARSILAPAELPVGVITAFIGAPFFAYLFIRRGRHA